jgi:hypothetical protein
MVALQRNHDPDEVGTILQFGQPYKKLIVSASSVTQSMALVMLLCSMRSKALLMSTCFPGSASLFMRSSRHAMAFAIFLLLDFIFGLVRLAVSLNALAAEHAGQDHAALACQVAELALHRLARLRERRVQDHREGLGRGQQVRHEGPLQVLLRAHLARVLGAVERALALGCALEIVWYVELHRLDLHGGRGSSHR